MRKEVFKYLKYIHRRLFRFYKLTNNLFYFSTLLYLSCVMIWSLEVSFLIWGIVNFLYLGLHFRRRFKVKVVLTIGVILFVVIQIRYFSEIVNNNRNVSETEIIGEVSERPNLKEYYSEVVISTNNLDTKILVKNFSSDDLELGDFVNLKGEIISISNTDLSESYKNYLISKGIAYLSDGKIFKISDSQNTLIRISNALNFQIKKILTLNLLPSTSSLIQGMVLGDRSEILDETYDQFSLIGVTHILVASGSNFTILVLLIKFLFKKIFNYKLTLLVCLIASLLLYLMIGPGNIPTERAMFMLLIYIVFELLGKPIRLTVILILYLTFTLLSYPYYIHNVSLQLSVFALLGIVLFANNINQFVKVKLKSKTLSELIAATIAASAFTGIITLTKFGGLALIGIIANVVILPFVPLIFYITIPMVILNLLGIQILNFYFNYYLNFISRIILSLSEHLANISTSIKSLIGDSIILSIALLLIYLILLTYSDFYAFKNR